MVSRNEEEGQMLIGYLWRSSVAGKHRTIPYPLQEHEFAKLVAIADRLERTCLAEVLARKEGTTTLEREFGTKCQGILKWESGHVPYHTLFQYDPSIGGSGHGSCQIKVESGSSVLDSRQEKHLRHHSRPYQWGRTGHRLAAGRRWDLAILLETTISASTV